MACPTAIAAVCTASIAFLPADASLWTAVLLLAAVAGVLALDDTALVQSWFSQPLPVGILTGAFCGDALTGLAIGLPVQLILAGNLPVGQSFTGDSVTSVVVAVGAVVTSGRSVGPGFAAADLPALALVGWMILAVGLISGVGHLVIQWERRAHAVWMLEGHRTLRDGNLRRMESIHARCLVATFLRGFVMTVIGLVFLRRAWLPIFDMLPGFAGEALAMLPLLLPGLGIGNLITHYGLRVSWSWVLAGTLVSFVVTKVVL